MSTIEPVEGVWNMYLNLLVESVSQSFSLDGEGAVSSLTFTCSHAKASHVLEIGDKHAFAHKGVSVERKRTRFSEMKLRLRRKDGLNAKQAERLALTKDKIGELGFHPACEKTDDAPAYPASLEAIVFVGDAEFESIVRSVSNGAPGMSLSIDLCQHPSIRYGWEPDGSRSVWAIQDPAESAYLPVEQVRMELPLYGAR